MGQSHALGLCKQSKRTVFCFHMWYEEMDKNRLEFCIHSKLINYLVWKDLTHILNLIALHFLAFSAHRIFSHWLQMKIWAIVLVSHVLTRGDYLWWETFSRGFTYWITFETACYMSRLTVKKKDFSKHTFCIKTRQISDFQNNLLERARLYWKM